MSLRSAVAALGLVVLASGACSPADESPDDEMEAPRDDMPAATAVDSAAAAAVAAAAEPVAAALMQTLSGNLMAAMDEGGPVAAMAFCQVEALPLTRQVTESQGMQVKRTSWRLRNPANAPDSLEEAALAHFAAAAADSEGAPAPWVQADPEGGYRYYRPLPTGPLCLNCHGSPDQLAEGVPEALERLYPDDEAVGFSQGELRGLLRVSVPASEVSASPSPGTPELP